MNAAEIFAATHRLIAPAAARRAVTVRLSPRRTHKAQVDAA